MASKENKRNIEEVESTSSNVGMEDTLKLDKEHSFNDTGCKIGKEKPLLQWGDIYRAVKEISYTELTEGEEIKENDLTVQNNICKSRINQEGARPCIMPCEGIIKIVIKQTDTDNRWVMNTKGQLIASFQPSSLNLCYKFLDVENNMDVEWFETTVKEVNKLTLIKSWSIDCKRLTASSNGLYKTGRL